ncbi:NUDIX hydrolase [Carboxylicivirga marina]|uniref:NUDIX hydrolase n=1 Tax=Carboxylicivirga marina TaxID=2800988 RepID=A0ABS1HQB8_9BACT|nr:NUDIX domain-containing protein [Carboxylicivirga marina]MBK3519841.1 NUDIX hydrolase [Carboxylicivirga marina]
MQTNTYEQYQENKRFVAVDCVVFGYEDDKLKLLVFQRAIEPAKGEWSLVGGWTNKEESTEDAARRVLQKWTGLQDVYLEQVHTFSDPNRDPGGSVITVEYYALIKIDDKTSNLIKDYGAKWYTLDELPPLIFDHDILVEKALEKLRLRSSYEIIGRKLLPEKFTLTRLRNIYDQIFMRKFDPGNFRKKILSLKVLERLEEKDMSESRKGAFYFKFKPKKEGEFSDPIFKRSI